MMDVTHAAPFFEMEQTSPRRRLFLSLHLGHQLHENIGAPAFQSMSQHAYGNGDD
jgi:hypothetical protein